MQTMNKGWFYASKTEACGHDTPVSMMISRNLNKLIAQ